MDLTLVLLRLVRFSQFRRQPLQAMTGTTLPKTEPASGAEGNPTDPPEAEGDDRQNEVQPMIDLGALKHPFAIARGAIGAARVYHFWGR